MLHYVAASRSARIVVTPLHESPGPATAGASLFFGRRILAWCRAEQRRSSQSRRKILPATGGASASDIGRAPRPMSKARHSAAFRSVCGASRGGFLSAAESQRRRQTLLPMTRLAAARENANFGAHAHPRFSAVDQNSKLGKMPPFGTTSGAHPDKPKERPDAQSHAHPCDRTAVRRIGGAHRRRANLARGQ
jgi:hypothetical protein